MTVLEQVLLRKGGIREKGFKPQSTHFLLMPTAFHVDAAVLAPGAAERYRKASRPILVTLQSVSIRCCLCQLCLYSSACAHVLTYMKGRFPDGPMLHT